MIINNIGSLGFLFFIVQMPNSHSTYKSWNKPNLLGSLFFFTVTQTFPFRCHGSLNLFSILPSFKSFLAFITAPNYFFDYTFSAISSYSSQPFLAILLSPVDSLIPLQITFNPDIQIVLQPRKYSTVFCEDISLNNM